MTRGQRLSIAATVAAGIALGSSLGEASPERSTTPPRTVAIVQPTGCDLTSIGPRGSRDSAGSVPAQTRLPASIARAVRDGADLRVVCGAQDATGAVLRAVAEGYELVLGSGPDVRAALATAAPDRPTVQLVASTR